MSVDKTYLVCQRPDRQVLLYLIQCWETFIGQEIYRLVLIDFLIALVGTFFSEFIRRLVSTLLL